MANVALAQEVVKNDKVNYEKPLASLFVVTILRLGLAQ